jgi:hypothetical protein
LAYAVGDASALRKGHVHDVAGVGCGEQAHPGFDRGSREHLTRCSGCGPVDPRVNIQRGKNGEATPYQVKQVLAAIKKMEEQS